MSRSWPLWQRRMLALGILGLLLWGVAVLIIGPVLQAYRANGEQIAQMERRLAEYRRIAADKPALEAEIERRHSVLRRAGYFLKSRTPSLASAELQELVRSRITEAKGKLVSSQAHETRLEDGRRKVIVDARMRGDIGALQQVLFKLVTSHPLVFVDELVVTGIRSRVVGRVRQAEDPSVQLLDVRLKASAYMDSAGEGT